MIKKQKIVSTKCPSCNGTGKCSSCRGTGFPDNEWQRGPCLCADGDKSKAGECVNCGGTGFIPE